PRVRCRASILTPAGYLGLRATASNLALSHAVGCERQTDIRLASLLASRGRGEDFAGGGRVGGDLCFEGVEAGEFLFRADELDQRHAQVAAVEVAGKIEQMRFEPRLRGADGRA